MFCLLLFQGERSRDISHSATFLTSLPCQVSNRCSGSGVYPRPRHFPLYNACSLRVRLSLLPIPTTYPFLGLTPSGIHGLSQPLAPLSLHCGFDLPLLRRTRGRLPPTAGPCLQETLCDFPTTYEPGEKVGCFQSSGLWLGKEETTWHMRLSWVSRLPAH